MSDEIFLEEGFRFTNEKLCDLKLNGGKFETDPLSIICLLAGDVLELQRLLLEATIKDGRR